MKHSIQPTPSLQRLLFILLAIMVSCTPKQEDPDPDNNNGIANPDKLTQSLKFKSSTTVTGTLSDIAKTVDLKIETDSIFWTKGLIKKVKMKKPNSVSIGSISFYVIGSSSYINVPLNKNEETDSISVFDFDFDTDNWVLPISFDVRIVPRKDDGTPLDQFDLPVTIDDGKSSDCSFKTGQVWKWISTTGSNFQWAPLSPQVANGTIAGCCDSDGNSFYSNCFNTPSHRVVNYQNFVVVTTDFLKFFEGGDVGGQLFETTQNIQPQLTDFCGGSPGYKTTNIANVYNGKYTFDSGNCTIKIENLEGLTEPVFSSDGIKLGDFVLPIYAGSGSMTEYKIISKHFMKETRSGEGGSLTRIYEAHPTGALTWYD